MSLESVIAENTAAIRELIAALANGKPVTAAQVDSAGTEVKETKAAKTDKPKAEKKADTPKPEAAESSAATQEQKDEPAAAEVTKDDVVAATLALGKAGKRNQLVEKLTELGVPKASALDEPEWAGYVAWANALLEA